MATTVTLKRTGAKMPLVGFGLWKVTKETCAATVYNAIKEGYRLFDGASDYGNEKEAGEGLARAIKEGLVKREDIWITSKLWNTHHEKERVAEGCKYSLSLWGLDYFDLYLVHFPISLQYIDPKTKFPQEWWGVDGKSVHPINVPYQETWTAMESLVDSGLAKNIGMSNAQGALIFDVHRYARIEPQVLQVELHPYLTQEALIKYCKLLNIAITAYSSLGPQSYVELGFKGTVGLLEHNEINRIATQNQKTPAQVLLRWALQQGLAVIPKSNNHDRLVQNLACTNFELSQEQMMTISGLNANLRLNDPVEIDPRFGIFA